MSPITLFPLLISLASLLLQPDEVEIVFAGDAMQHQSQLDAAHRGSGMYDYSECFKAIAPYVRSADYAVVNLECPLGGEPYSGYPMFGAPDEYAAALRDAGFDLALTANNHTLDRRDKGLRRTLSVLDSLGIRHTGTFAPAESRNDSVPLIVDVRGFRIAFLNYTYGTNGIRHGAGVAVNMIDTAMIRRDIERALHSGAEIVAVCPHWGIEYRMLPEKSQRILAGKILDMGADMIIGAHPHVIQPMEFEEDSMGRGKLKVYSLGNFLSGMRTAETRGGTTVTVTLRRDRTGRAYIAGAVYRPVFTLTPLPASGENFRLIWSDTPVTDKIRETQRKDFERSATEIFDRYNVNVPRDTVPMQQVVKRRALRERHYLSNYDAD